MTTMVEKVASAIGKVKLYDYHLTDEEAAELAKVAIAEIGRLGFVIVPKAPTPAMAREVWANAVRAEWLAYIDTDPELKVQHTIALQLMRDGGHMMASAQEPLLSFAEEPMIVDGQKVLWVEGLAARARPLSAFYFDKVRHVQSAAARAAEAAKAKAPLESWGEYFARKEDE